MPLTKQQKEDLVQELSEKLSNSQSVIMAHFSGLGVDAGNALRKTIREIGGDFRVCKNTLFRLAAKDTQAEMLAEHFVGPCAVAIAYEDPVAVAKALVEFAKANEAIEIHGGVLNEKYMDRAGIEALSRLPSREVLLAQLLSVLVATPTGLVQALAGIPRKMLYALKAMEEQKA